MDGRNFDDLARKMASGVTRRSLLRGLIGGGAALGGLRGAGVLAAPKVTICHYPPDNPGNLQIISVGSASLPDHFAHGDTVFGDCCVDADCPASSGDCGVLVGCRADANGTSSCAYSDDSSICDDGDACNGLETCQQSACVAGTPIDCTGFGDQCNTGVCSGGQCIKQPIADGTGCNDDDLCTQTDTCQAGRCTGSNPVVCLASDECHDVGICNPSNGTCTNPPKLLGSPCGNAPSCDDDGEHAQDTCDGNGNCISGANMPCAPGEACVGTTCQVVCLGIQDVCTSGASECCDDGLTECHAYRCGPTGVTLPKCCHINGGSCGEDCDCCPGFQCVNNVCQPETCLELGDVCDPDNNACCSAEQAECHFIQCSDTQVRLPRCCHPDGSSCGVDCDCCPGLECTSGVCRAPLTCGSIGQGCVQSQCCGTLVCMGTPDPDNPFDVCVGQIGEPCRSVGRIQPFPGPIFTDRTTDCDVSAGLTCGPDLHCTTCGLANAACTTAPGGDPANSTCCLGFACFGGVCTG